MNPTTKRYAIGGLAVLGLLAAFVTEERVRGHLNLKSWERAMRAKGEKLSVAELAPPITNSGVRVLNPGQFQLLLLTTGTQGPAVDRKEVPDGKEVVLWRLAHWQTQPGQTNGWEGFAAEFGPIRERLPAIRQGLTNESIVIQLPYEQGFNGLLPHLSSVKGAATTLRLGTLLALQEGRLDEAVENIRTAAALVEIQRQEGLIISQLVRMAVAEIGLGQMVWQSAQADGWTDAQLASIQAAWAASEFVSAMIRALQMERGMVGSYYQGRATSAQELASSMQMADSPGGASSAELGSLRELLAPVIESGAGVRRFMFVAFWQFAWAEQDQLFHHQGIQQLVDAAGSAARARDFSSFRQRDRGGTGFSFGLPAAFDPAKMSRWERNKHWLTLMMLGSSDVALEKAVSIECHRELALTAIALKRHRLRHGAWPARLEDLVPALLPEVPRDWMNGQPLRYRVNPDGTYSLYSVGMDGIDDGGDPTQVRGVAWHFSRGRDWVWPVPASEAEVSGAMRTSGRKRFPVPVPQPASQGE